MPAQANSKITPAHGDSNAPISPPVYSSILTTGDLPEGLKEAAIFDQISLEKKWSSIQEQLRNQPISEEEVLQILKSGFLQTDTGKTLAPLFVEAIMRSVKPLDGLRPARLREFVTSICHLPPEQWANAFGENVNFPRGLNGEGVHGFIQSQLQLASAQREQKIAAGRLLDDDAWTALRDFTKRALSYFREGSLGAISRQLEDFNNIRPSPEQAKALMVEFVSELVKEIEEPSPGIRHRWSKDFPNTVRMLYDRLMAIETIDNQPRRSWLEQIVDLGKLGASTANSVAMAAHDFVFGVATEPRSELEPSQTRLLLDMQEVENKSSFYHHIGTTPLRPDGSIAGALVYVLNAANGLGGEFALRQGLPHAIDFVDNLINPTTADNIVPTEIHPNSSATFRAEVNDDLVPLPAQSEPAVHSNISVESQTALPSQSASLIASESTLEQMTQAVLETLNAIDDFLTRAVTFPPLAKAASVVVDVEQLLLELDEIAENLVCAKGTVAPLSWWEHVGPMMHTTLSRLSGVLSTYALATGSAAVQLAKDRPGAAVATVTTVTTVTTVYLAVLAIYDRFFQQYPDHSPVESPALHQELIEDKVELILDAPIAKGQQPLSEVIIELMYESSEHNLLADDLLIGKVALLLQQPSPQVPAKTYAELIKQAQAEIHDHDAPVQPPDIHPSPSQRVKRDTAAVDAGFASFYSPDGGEPPADAVESEADIVAQLTQYLKTMDELQNVGILTDADPGGDPVDSPTDVARQVIRVLRKRRDVLWMDSSRAAGDRELIPGYTAALLQHASGSSGVGVKVDVPRHSTFGLYWVNYLIAIGNPFFSEWAAQAGLELSTLKINTLDGSLSGKFKGIQTTKTLADNSGWADVAKPIINAAKVISPSHEGVPYPSGLSVPFELICAFYGEDKNLDEASAQQRANELNEKQTFSRFDDKLIDTIFIERQERYVADLYNYGSLITELTSLVKDKPDNALVKLDGLISIRKDSSFALRHPIEAQRMITARRFIDDGGWFVPRTAADVRNFIAVVSFAMPDSPANGNCRGALGYNIPPTDAQQKIIRDTVNGLVKNGGLLKELLENKAVTSPAQGLLLALDSPKAKTLGEILEAKLDSAGISTAASVTEWVMAAMLLDLDPTPGMPRNHVAGYNLTQEANWGAKPATVVANLQSHLVATGKVDATTAPVAAYHLLAALAPEFLVRNLPDNLICGSHTWATFRIATARIEQINPGAVLEMTFDQVMKYGETAAISVGQQLAEQMVSVDPLIDWAIANGVIQQTATGTYSLQQLGIAREKFQESINELGRAQNYLTAPLPTRKDIALAELTRVFGEGYPFEERLLKESNRDGQAKTKIDYSMLDLYMTGDLTIRKYVSTDQRLPLNELRSKFSQLKAVGPLFEKEFTAYFDNLCTGSETIFKYLVSQLPPDDRKNLEYGKTKYYSLRSAVDAPLHLQTAKQVAEQVAAEVGHHGILIRSEYQQKVTYYEVFPSAVEIRKRTDLPSELTLGGKITSIDNSNLNGIPLKKEVATPQKFDLDAYKKGTTSRGGVTSNVIIDEIKPLSQTDGVASKEFARIVPNVFSSPSVRHIASVAVKEHFIIGRDQLRSFAAGVTDSEKDIETNRKVRGFFQSLIPFKDCVEEIADGKVADGVVGCLIDAAGFFMPVGSVAGKIGKIAKSAGRFGPKLLKISWVTSTTIGSAANPLDGLGGLANIGKNAVIKLGSQAYRVANFGLEQTRKLYGGKTTLFPQLLTRADVTAGTINAVEAGGEAIKVTALFKEGKWYAYDVAGNRPYGVPLENFRADSSIPLERTTFSDGSTPLTPSRLFEAEPHTIQRTSSVDVVVGDKVYRFDPKHPETLEDLSSPVYFKDLEGFEAVCSSGGRSRRAIGESCFSKTINPNLISLAERRVQALEHKRIFPTTDQPGEQYRVVHERRIYNCDSALEKCSPEDLKSVLEFKSRTSGSFIPNEHFGFAAKLKDAELDQITRVVRINDIVPGIDDAREARAILVDIPGSLYGKTTYAVVEADTGLFYYCRYEDRYDGLKINNLEFTRIEDLQTGLGADLIKKYQTIKDPIISAGIDAAIDADIEKAVAAATAKGSSAADAKAAALRAYHSISTGKRFDRDFISLPTLESLYKDLREVQGWADEDIINFKRIIAKFSDEQKRELMVESAIRNKKLNLEIIIPAIKIDPIPKPPGFDDFSESSQNRIYAIGAKKNVDEQLSASGVGSGNQRIKDDSNDALRLSTSRPLVAWMYSRAGTPGYAELILKLGAGNCDQMAIASYKNIVLDGGIASIWSGGGVHSFTVVGIPMGYNPKSTVDFSEPEYADAWVVDPWADVICPAKEYQEQLRGRMAEWSLQGKQILIDDRAASPPVARWVDANSEVWMNKAIDGPKNLQALKKKEP